MSAGHPRVALVTGSAKRLGRALIERLDQTTRIAEGLAERVAVLERLAVQDEARIALEIEKMRHAKDHS